MLSCKPQTIATIMQWGIAQIAIPSPESRKKLKTGF
jgi:hypothetical protein